MTYDIATRVSNNQSITLSLSTASESSIKIISLLGSPLALSGRDVGAGADIKFRVMITQAFDVGVATLNASVIVSANENLSSPTIIGSTSIIVAGLPVGSEFDVRVPSLSESQAAGSTFLGLLYLPSASPISGAVSAWIPLGHSANRPRRLAGNYTGP